MNFFNSFNPFGEDEARMHYENVYRGDALMQPHHASKMHELVAGAAGWAAMSAYESHIRATGEEPSHPLMKKILAGIAAAEVDKLIETKGLDAIDRHRAHKMAEQQAHMLAEQRYGGSGGWEYARSMQGPAFEYNNERRTPWGMQGCPSYDWGYGGGGGREYGPPGGGYGAQEPPPPGYGGGYGGGYSGGGYGGGYGGGGQGGYGGPPGYGGGYSGEGYGGGSSGYAPEYAPPPGPPGPQGYY